MIDWSQQLWLTLLDKGLLACIVVALAWFLNRSLERLKSSLSWRNEILKERLDKAKAVLLKFNNMEDAYRKLSGQIELGLPVDKDTYEDFMRSKKALFDIRREAGLVLSPGTIEQVMAVNDATTRLVPLLKASLDGQDLQRNQLASSRPETRN